MLSLLTASPCGFFQLRSFTIPHSQFRFILFRLPTTFSLKAFSLSPRVVTWIDENGFIHTVDRRRTFWRAVDEKSGVGDWGGAIGVRPTGGNLAHEQYRRITLCCNALTNGGGNVLQEYRQNIRTNMVGSTCSGAIVPWNLCHWEFNSRDQEAAASCRLYTNWRHLLPIHRPSHPLMHNNDTMMKRQPFDSIVSVQAIVHFCRYCN